MELRLHFCPYLAVIWLQQTGIVQLAQGCVEPVGNALAGLAGDNGRVLL